MNRKCWECGAEGAEYSMNFKENFYFDEEIVGNTYANPYSLRAYCKKCFEQHNEDYKRELDAYVRTKKKIMFERAVRTLEHQNLIIDDYMEAIKVVQDFISANPDKFDSSYEVIAAIMLVKGQIHSKMQYKVGRYQVDFLLDEMMVVLEIDGERHKHRKEYDAERDKTIRKILGPGWEIIRIKTEYLDKHAKHLVEAIKETLDYRAFGKYVKK